jgi:hypothetical protein
VKKERNLIMKNNNNNKPYAPINYHWYKQASVYALKIKHGNIGWDPVNKEKRTAIVGYKLECLKNTVSEDGRETTAIEQLCACKTYSNFKLNNYSIQEVFNIIEAEYASGSIEKAQRLYNKAIDAIREHNEAVISLLNSSKTFRLNRDKYQELGEKHDARVSSELRWNKLMQAMPKRKTPLTERIENLSEEQRQDWLFRAADYGLNTPKTELLRKDIYTMRMASVSMEADLIHMFNTYHPVTESDPIKTIVGKHRQTVTRIADENETIATAMWLAQYGDEFMEKCRPLYDVIDRHWVLTKDIDTTNITREEVLEMFDNDELDTELVVEVLFTGTAAQCEEQLETLRLTHPNCSLVPSDKEITVREARLLGITEYDSYGEDGKLCIRDFTYDAEDILD